MRATNLDEDELYMGFITQALCSVCGTPTFAMDGVCYSHKVEEAEEERLFDKTPRRLLDCE